MRPVIAAEDGDAQRVEQWLARAKCSACRTSFTCYPGELYPRRQYQLDAVAQVVAAVSLGDQGAPAAARAIGASPTSVRRWVGWVAALVEPGELLRATVQVDPTASAGSGISRHVGDGVRGWEASACSSMGGAAS